MHSHHVPSLMMKPILAAACLSAGLAGQALGVVTPNPTYSVDFDDPSDVTEFTSYVQTTPNANTWAVTGGVWQHQFSSNGGGGSTVGQTVQTSGIVGQNFSMATDFKLTSRNTFVDWIVGLAVLTNGNLGQFDGSASWYMAAVRLDDANNDTLDFVQDNGAYGTSVTGSSNGQSVGFTLATNTVYHLSVTGTYTAGQLVLSTTLTDTTTPANTFTVTTLPIAAPKTGDRFGYSEVSFFGAGGTVEYDNFVISVPEPTSLAMLMLSLAPMARRRRRQVIA